MEKELSITRVFDAPRHLVFDAWTKPEHLKRWFAPEGFTVHFRTQQLPRWRVTIIDENA